MLKVEVLSENCPKCGFKMFNAPPYHTRCQRCNHEWTLVPQKGVESKQPDKYAAHHLACITRVTGGLEGPCDCGVESSPQKGVE